MQKKGGFLGGNGLFPEKNQFPEKKVGKCWCDLNLNEVFLLSLLNLFTVMSVAHICCAVMARSSLFCLWKHAGVIQGNWIILHYREICVYFNPQIIARLWAYRFPTRESVLVSVCLSIFVDQLSLLLKVICCCFWTNESTVSDDLFASSQWAYIESCNSIWDLAWHTEVC